MSLQKESERVNKPSKRIEEIVKVLKAQQPYTGGELLGYAVYFANMKARAIISYLDEQAELLETHTVKEENLCVNCKDRKAIVGMLCDYCRSEGWKEQPTTPEKECPKCKWAHESFNYGLINEQEKL